MRSAGWVPVALLSVGMVSACQSTGLAPTGDRVVGAVGCTVVFPGPEHIDITGVVRWEYKQNENDPELTVVLYYVASPNPEILPEYKDRVVFNMSDWSLGLKMQLADQGLYRLRREEEEKSGKWIKLEVIVFTYRLVRRHAIDVLGSIPEVLAVGAGTPARREEYAASMGGDFLPRLDRESQEPSSGSLMVVGGRNFLTEPLSKPELFRNSSLAGSTIEMVCNVTVGRVDSYQWKKDHKPLPRSDHYQLSWNNSVLLILNAIQADSGCYSCKVTNEVSENETSLELTISDSLAVVSNGVIWGVAVITAVVILVIADGNLYSE